MTHPEYVDMFSAYYDGELAPDDRARLEAHLAACAGCAAEWDSFRQTVSEVSGLLRPQLPDDFAQRVTARIRRRSKGRFFATRPRVAPLSVYTAALVVLVAAVLYLILVLSRDVISVEPIAPDGDTAAPPAATSRQ